MVNIDYLWKLAFITLFDVGMILFVVSFPIILWLLNNEDEREYQ